MKKATYTKPFAPVDITFNNEEILKMVKKFGFVETVNMIYENRFVRSYVEKMVIDILNRKENK